MTSCTPMTLVVEAVGAQLGELAAANTGEFHAATLDDFVDFARRAERAGIDALFYADFMGKPREQFARRPLIPFEPLTALAAVAARTSAIGLVATVSTTFSEPYTVARQIASLDNLSNGRAGWNIVTSIQGHGNYGRTELGAKTDRYARATEFTDAVVRLWSAWSPGYRNGHAQGTFVDTDAITELDFTGEHLAVSGWLDVPSDAQDRPVLFQAGSSAAGIEFAARFADVVFGISPTKKGARNLRTRLRDIAARHGRDPDSVLFLPGVRVDVDRESQSDRPAPPALIRATVGALLGVSVDGIDVDAPVPASVIAQRRAIDADASTISGTTNAFWDLAEEPGATLRRLHDQRERGSGFLYLDGTAQQIADRMRSWVDDGAADGFVLGAGGPIDAFYTDVMPRLRDPDSSGNSRTPSTLRERLGLGGPL